MKNIPDLYTKALLANGDGRKEGYWFQFSKINTASFFFFFHNLMKRRKKLKLIRQVTA